VADAIKVALVSSGLFAALIGLLVFVARLYFTGKLVPRTTLDDMRVQYEARLTREAEISSYYRINSEAVTASLARQIQLTEKLVEEQQTIKEFIFGLRGIHGPNPVALPEGKSNQ